MSAAAALAEAAWRTAFDRVAAGRCVDAGPGGVAVQPLYPPDTAPALGRGLRQPCVALQRVDHPDPGEANRLARRDIEDAASGLALCFARSEGVRGFGLPDERAALTVAFAGLDLAGVPLRLDLPPFAGPDLPLAVTRLGGDLALDVGLDPLGDMARLGGAPAPWPGLAKALATSVQALRAEGLTGALLRADGRVVHEAGGTQAQELAAVLATGLAYYRALDTAGVSLEEAQLSLSFTLVADADVLLTIAKCRALRILWSAIESACGLTPTPLRLHVETAWRCMTRRDPFTNIVRGTLGCAAALLGGADSVTVLPFTSVLGLPEESARRLARNTPLILLKEAHLGRVADPGAGAGAVAGLTEALRAEAWTLFQAIEAAGGMPAALQSGQWQSGIAEARLRRQTAVTDGTLPLVGSTFFAQADADKPPDVLFPRRTDPRPMNAAWAVPFPAFPSLRDAAAVEGSP